MYLYLSISVFVSVSVGRICHFFQLCKKGGGQNSYKYNPSIHGHHNDGDVDEKVDEGGWEVAGMMHNP